MKGFLLWPIMWHFPGIKKNNKKTEKRFHHKAVSLLSKKKFYPVENIHKLLRGDKAVRVRGDTEGNVRPSDSTSCLWEMMPLC